MAVYPGILNPIAGWGIKRIPICFTGSEAINMTAALIFGGVFLGTLIGGVIGLIISFSLGPEIVPQAVLGFGGAVLGGLIGLYLSVDTVYKGNCNCPPGSYGFCINLILFKPPFSNTLLPWAPFFESAPAQCPILVPPGCP